MITVHYDDFTVGEYETTDEAEDAILEAHAEGISVDYVHDSDNEDKVYSLIWAVELQEES